MDDSYEPLASKVVEKVSSAWKSSHIIKGEMT